MPPADASPIDFLTLVGWWNLFGLPLLLLVSSVLLIMRQRGRAGASAKSPAETEHETADDRDRVAAVRLIALIHLGLAVRSAIGLVQELLTLREQGIPQSFPLTGILWPGLSILLNMAIGHGLWRYRRWGRRLAIGWDLVVAIIAALVATWQWSYGAVVHLQQWPDYVVSDLLPWFLLVVMLLPGTRRAFVSQASGSVQGPDQSSAASRWPLVLQAVCSLLLIVVMSTAVVDAADWIVRTRDVAGGVVSP